jgi:hypothetical protein
MQALAQPARASSPRLLLLQYVKEHNSPTKWIIHILKNLSTRLGRHGRHVGLDEEKVEKSPGLRRCPV